MCVTTRRAELSDTKIFVGETSPTRCTLAYQNKAASEGSNCMILPVPATQDVQLIDMTSARDLLAAQSKLFQKQFLSGSRGLALSSTMTARSLRVEKVGSYTVIVARGSTSDEILKAIEALPPQGDAAKGAASAEGRRASRQSRFSGAKSPDGLPQGASITREFLDSYLHLYRGWTLLLCFWEGDIEAEPLACSYDNALVDRLHIPMVDAHDGRPPSLTDRSLPDHFVAYGSYHYLGDRALMMPPVPEPIREHFTPRFYGKNIRGERRNVDLAIQLDSVRRCGIGYLTDFTPEPLAPHAP